jgi:putative tryptophan/tyrosine transport system substrate-binding protein
VDKLLKRATAGELPIQIPTKFELVVNLKTAKSLGIVVGPPIIGRAGAVIK